jgi:hypothetical protein
MKKLKRLIRLKYTQSWIISTKGKPVNYCSIFLENLDGILKHYDFKTKASSSNIEFEKIYRSTNNYGDNLREAMKVIRTGKIDLLIKPNDTVIIESVVDLSHLTFMTIFLGLIILLIGWILFNNLTGPGILALVLMILTFLVGLGRVVSRMDGLIEIAKRKT